jgi:3-oxoacyl-[acyl-carrier protein] reductase
MKNAALITGASRGIGRGIALELAGLGWDLLINYASNEGAARETAAACVSAAEQQGRRIVAHVFRADVGSAEERDALVREACQRFARLGLLVNNAGVAPQVRADLLEATEESFDRLMRINVKGPYFLTQAIARWMLETLQSTQATDDYRPKIVTISSISAYTASTNRGDYCVAKAALSMLTPLYAARLAENGINVYEIRPGIIATDMTGPVKEKYDRLIAEGLTPIRRWGQPADVAKAVAAIASELLPFSTGEVINVDGGFHLRRL